MHSNLWCTDDFYLSLSSKDRNYVCHICAVRKYRFATDLPASQLHALVKAKHIQDLSTRMEHSLVARLRRSTYSRPSLRRVSERCVALIITLRIQNELS